MTEIELNNGMKAKYVGVEMSGDVYKIKLNCNDIYLIDISNGFAEIDFHTCSEDFEPYSRVKEEYRPKESFKSTYGKLERV